MRATPKPSSKASDIFRLMPLEEMVNLFERWIISYDSKPEEVLNQEQNQDLARWYLRILLERLNNLWKNQRKWKTDDLRDRIVVVLWKLKEISNSWQQVKLVMSDVWDKAKNFLSNYWFAQIHKIEELKSFLDKPENRKQLWNNIKFNSFLTHLFHLKWSYGDKANLLIDFLSIDNARSCRWSDENYNELARIITWMSNRRKTAELRRLFNSLPWIQGDRRPWKNKNENDPWYALYYEQDSDVAGEAKWLPVDTLWKMPQRLWVVAARTPSK